MSARNLSFKEKPLSSLNSLRSLKSLTVLAAFALFTACDNGIDETLSGAGEALTLSARMDAPLTRGTVNDAWDGGEQVRVNVNGTVYDFTVAADGSSTLTPSPAIYWQDVNNTVEASAWYPEIYAFQTDQSTAAKLQLADFLFANKVTGITKANYTSMPLTFAHKTAKVTVQLIKGDGIASVSGASVQFYGYTSVTAIDQTSTGAITGSTNDWITPFANVEGGFTALLIPQTYTETNLLKVSLDGQEYFWKPASQVIEAGKSYTFDITVKKSGLTVSSTITGWADGGPTDADAFTKPTFDDEINIDDPLPGLKGFNFSNGTLTIVSKGSYTIFGVTTLRRIVVASGVTADITFNWMDINAGGYGGIAFDMTGARVNLFLMNTGANKLKSGGDHAAIQAADGTPNSVLVISGVQGATLEAIGGIGTGATITLPAAYKWWTNTVNSDPGGEGTSYPGTPFVNSNEYKYVKIEIL